MAEGFSQICRTLLLQRMENLLSRLLTKGYEISFNPPGTGDCFYQAVAFQLDIDWQTLKRKIFDHLKQNQFDVSLLN